MSAYDRTVFHWGTRREMYAAMILEALLSNGMCTIRHDYKDNEQLIQKCIDLADKFGEMVEKSYPSTLPPESL